MKLAHRLAHTLKGYASQIGEKTLTGLAAAVEDRLHTDKIINDDEISSLEDELRNVLKRLELLTADIMVLQVSQTAEPVSVEEQLVLLNELKSLLKEKSVNSLHYTNTLRIMYGMGELADLIEDYDFSEALQMLADVIKRLEE
jgi:chemotaxis protein histidine kinase CheA